MGDPRVTSANPDTEFRGHTDRRLPRARALEWEMIPSGAPSDRIRVRAEPAPRPLRTADLPAADRVRFPFDELAPTCRRPALRFGGYSLRASCRRDSVQAAL